MSEIMKEKIAEVRALLCEGGSSFWTDRMIIDCLRLAEYFQILYAIRMLKLADNEDFPVEEQDVVVGFYKSLTDEKRKELREMTCECGSLNTKCSCWNDE